MTSMSSIIWLSLFVVFITGTTSAVTLKSECLVHQSPGEHGDYEGEENEEADRGGREGGGGENGEEGGGGFHEPQRGHHSKEEAEDEDEGQGGNGHGQTWPRGHGQVERHNGRRFLDEEGEWEDAKRRRKRGDNGHVSNFLAHTQDTLVGQLSCTADSIIHIHNVTVGYTDTRQCLQAYPGCQAGSPLAKQIIHCQGNRGVCDITIARHFMIRCGHQANFALIFYECIPAAEPVDICSNTNVDVSNVLVLASPSYQNNNWNSGQPEPTTGMPDTTPCECTLRSAPNSHMELEFVRTHLPISGTTCEGDMLVLERPDPAKSGRYLVEREICGHNVSRDVAVPGNVMRVTFLGGASLSAGKAGFIAKFRALTSEGTGDMFHVSCVRDHGSVQISPTKVTGHLSTQVSRKSSMATTKSPVNMNTLLDWLKANGRTLPPNFDPASLPANSTPEQWQSRGRARSQKIVGTQNEQPAHASENDGAIGGVLSGVVASLASVIVILGSLGALMLYRRHQKKKSSEKQHQAEWQGCQKDPGHHTKTSDIGAGIAQKGRNLDPSLKEHQRRPLPQISSGGEIHRTQAKIDLRDDIKPEVRNLRHVQNGRKVPEPETGCGHKLPSIYLLASDLSSSREEMSSSREEMSSSREESSFQYEDNGEDVRCKRALEMPTRTQNPPSDSQEATNQSPQAPPRKKRSQAKQLKEPMDDYQTNPYDNAAGNNNSEKMMLATRVCDTQDVISAMENGPNLGRKSSFDVCCGDTDDNYSSIKEIHLAVNYLDNQDNTEV